MGAIDEAAGVGFGRAAGEYERARPGYPVPVLDAIAATGALEPGRVVVDLAAGTGKLTRLLAERGAAPLVAIEPVEAMRGALVGTDLVVSGTAERLPLRERSVDLVAVAQAFHWFRLEEAFAELHRVLRPGGWVALVWNERDDREPWVARWTEIVDRHGGGRPYRRDRDWAALLAEHGFVGVRTERHPNPVTTTRAGVVERAASTSFIAALPEDRRAACLAEVADLVAGFEEPFTYPHTTEVHLARTP